MTLVFHLNKSATLFFAFDKRSCCWEEPDDSDMAEMGLEEWRQRMYEFNPFYLPIVPPCSDQKLEYIRGKSRKYEIWGRAGVGTCGVVVGTKWGLTVCCSLLA